MLGKKGYVVVVIVVVYLILYACDEIFNMMENLVNFWNFEGSPSRFSAAGTLISLAWHWQNLAQNCEELTVDITASPPLLCPVSPTSA